MNKRGFTLIELLIVVAIIAILAAIAIPNFIEAQIRSKIARAKADMRSIASGVEAYRVDYSSYPPDSRLMVNRGVLTAAEDNIYLHLQVITTPVAYMSSVPKDPFPKRWVGYMVNRENQAAKHYIWTSEVWRNSPRKCVFFDMPLIFESKEVPSGRHR